jgi:tetratricopeptide (TPR) repeat protein
MTIFWILIAVAAAIVIYWMAQHRSRTVHSLNRPQEIAHDTVSSASSKDINGLSLAYKVMVRDQTPTEIHVSDLLKDATQKHKDKDLPGAIECLRQAYSLLAKLSVSYPIETYLRLPLYLQQNKQYDESVREFNKLLADAPAKTAKEFSHISKRQQDGLTAMERGIIYDKMRLAAQREKQFVSAVYCQILSDAHRCLGLKLQGRKDEFEGYVDRESWLDSIEDLLAKAKKGNAWASVLSQQCMAFVKVCSVSALDKLSMDVADILGIESFVPVSHRTNPPKPERDLRLGDRRSEDFLQWLGQAVCLHVIQAREAWDRPDYALARQEYQKAAQAITQIEGQQWAKERLKEEQKQFAKDDPLYRELLPLIRAYIADNPGVLQTSLYEAIPHPKEDISYTVYFAALLNDLKRDKKGRTYALHLSTTSH